MGWSYQGLTETASVNVTLGTLVNQTYSVDGAANPYPLDAIIFTVSTPTAVQLVFTDTGTNDSSSFAGGVLNNIENSSDSGARDTGSRRRCAPRHRRVSPPQVLRRLPSHPH